MPYPVTVIDPAAHMPPRTVAVPGPTVGEALEQALRVALGDDVRDDRRHGALLVCAGAMYRIGPDGFRCVANDTVPFKGFMQLTVADLIREPDYWLAHLQYADSHGRLSTDLKAELFRMLFGAGLVLLANRPRPAPGLWDGVAEDPRRWREMLIRDVRRMAGIEDT